jgi:hypothetical protein
MVTPDNLWLQKGRNLEAGTSSIGMIRTTLGSVLVLTLFWALASGCSPERGDEAAGLALASTPVATPDLRPTVEALVQQRLAELLAEMPTPEPIYWPTIEDYKIVALPRAVGYSGLVRSALLRYFDQYAAVYAASKCLAGEQLTPRGFRGFVDGTLLMRTADGREAIVVSAADVIRRIIARADSQVELRSCERVYLYPESGAEATLAVGLYLAGVVRSVPVDLQEGHVTFLESRAAQWFNLDPPPTVSLLAWLCGSPCGLSEEKGVQR